MTITREMTKKFEEILEMDIQNAIEYFNGHEPRGEFTVIIHRKE